MIKNRGQFLPLIKFFFGKFYRVAPQKIEKVDFSYSRTVFSIKKSSEKNKKEGVTIQKKIENS